MPSSKFSNKMQPMKSIINRFFNPQKVRKSIQDQGNLSRQLTLIDVCVLGKTCGQPGWLVIPPPRRSSKRLAHTQHTLVLLATRQWGGILYSQTEEKGQTKTQAELTKKASGSMKHSMLQKPHQLPLTITNTCVNQGIKGKSSTLWWRCAHT